MPLPSSKNAVLILLGLLLLCALGLQLNGVGETRQETLTLGLAGQLPADVPGWSVEDLPLGDTEARDANALKVLNMDEYVVRRYRQGEDSITVYVAYWGPGRMDTRLVASHTPDRCWTANGWSCTQTDHQRVVQTGTLTTKPGEYRVFEYTGHTEHVLYWLLVQGEPYDFGNRLNTIPDPWKFTRDFIRQLRRGKPQQVFVRINSTLSPQALQHEPLFAEIVRSLSQYGLSVQTAE